MADFDFPFVEFAFDGLLPTFALALAFSDALPPAAFCALFAVVFAIDCVLETALLTAVVAPLVSALPVAEPLAVAEPPFDDTFALPVPDPEPFAALDAPCAVLEVEDCAAFAVLVAAFVAAEVSVFASALA